MTDVQIPITTVWDVIADALDDPWFWGVSIAVTMCLALAFRFLHERRHRRCRSRPSSEPSHPSSDG